MRKPPIPETIIAPTNDTSTTQKEDNSESNEKDDIWIELEDMSPLKKKSADKSYVLTPKAKKNLCDKEIKERKWRSHDSNVQ